MSLFFDAGPKETYIPIKPASYGVEQRVEASAKATEMGQGLHMAVGNMTTRFYASPAVPVGKVRITAPPTYKAMPEYVTTLDDPTQHWNPRSEEM